MRILFTVWGGLRGERTPYEDVFIAGAELACRQHAETLAEYGHEVTFACLGPRDRDESIKGVRLIQRRHPLAGRELPWQTFWEEHFESVFDASVAWTADLVRRHDIEAIYTRVLWPTGLLGCRVQQATGVPCIATVDDKVFVEQLLDGPNLLPASVRGPWAAEMSEACEGLSRLILLARHLDSEVGRFTESPAPWSVIPSGLDLARFADVTPVDWRARLGLSAERVLLMCAARLDWPKRQDLLIAAVGNLVAAGLDAGLILVGAGSEEAKLKQAARHCGVESRVHFLGYQPNDAVPASLLGADVICTPTDWEAFPIQLLEALATEHPMVASDAPPYDDVLAGQDCIPLCANDAPSWTAALGETIVGLKDAQATVRRRVLVRQLLGGYTQAATSRAIESVLMEAAGTVARV